MKKFRVRNSTDMWLSISELNKFVNPFGESDEEFESKVRELVEIAMKEKKIMYFGGGGLLDLFVHENGVIEIVSGIMALDMVEIREKDSECPD